MENVIQNLTYGPRTRNGKEFEELLNDILSADKEVIIAGDFKMNLLDFEQNRKAQNFVNIIFGHSMMASINKPKYITVKTGTAIDRIFINCVTTSKFKIEIIKSDISDYFSKFFVVDYNIHIKETKEHHTIRRHLSDIFVEEIK